MKIYLFLSEYCLRISAIFFAWVNEPPDDEIVTMIAYGLIKTVFFKPLTIESVLIT